MRELEQQSSSTFFPLGILAELPTTTSTNIEINRAILHGTLYNQLI
jgi:hypothetical protein